MHAVLPKLNSVVLACYVKISLQLVVSRVNLFNNASEFLTVPEDLIQVPACYQLANIFMDKNEEKHDNAIVLSNPLPFTEVVLSRKLSYFKGFEDNSHTDLLKF